MLNTTVLLCPCDASRLWVVPLLWNTLLSPQQGGSSSGFRASTDIVHNLRLNFAGSSPKLCRSIVPHGLPVMREAVQVNFDDPVDKALFMNAYVRLCASRLPAQVVV